jgi:hypothetical protein
MEVAIMFSEGTQNAFGLSLALTNKTDVESADMENAEYQEVLETERKKQLKKEVDILVNQIGKMDQPIG